MNDNYDGSCSDPLHKIFINVLLQANYDGEGGVDGEHVRKED